MRKFVLLSALLFLIPSANAGIIRTTFKVGKAVTKTAVKTTVKVVKVGYKVVY